MFRSAWCYSLNVIPVCHQDPVLLKTWPKGLWILEVWSLQPYLVAKRKVVGSTPSQGTCLGGRFGPRAGHVQETTSFLLRRCYSSSLFPSLCSSLLKKKKAPLLMVDCVYVCMHVWVCVCMCVVHVGVLVCLCVTVHMHVYVCICMCKIWHEALRQGGLWRTKYFSVPQQKIQPEVAQGGGYIIVGSEHSSHANRSNVFSFSVRPGSSCWRM